jgi:hypothetical protein
VFTFLKFKVSLRRTLDRMHEKMLEIRYLSLYKILNKDCSSFEDLSIIYRVFLKELHRF